ncbi:MAG: fused MFS/spermidine synthase [Pirellulales bacterium]
MSDRSATVGPAAEGAASDFAGPDRSSQPADLSSACSASAIESTGTIDRRLLALALVSGAVALGYQVIWTRLFRETFGVSWHAGAAVVATFLGGLAVGGWWLGPRADRQANLLRWYALLELGVAGSVVLGIGCLRGVEPLHLWLARQLDGAPWPLMVIRIGLAALVILPATICMGATLPALVAHGHRSPETFGRRVAALYAANTLGAMFGVLVSSFYLLAAFGLHATLGLALIVNLCLAAVAWVWSLAPSVHVAAEQRTESAMPARDRVTESGRRAGQASAREERLGLSVVGLSGFVALALQMLWMRLIVLQVGASGYAFALVVATFLAGIVVGSVVLYARGDRWRDPRWAYGLVQLWLAGAIWATLPLLGVWRPSLFGEGAGGGTQDMNLGVAAGHAALTVSGWWREYAWTFAVLLVPASLMGVALPLASRWYEQHGRGDGESVGRIWAAASLGNVLGALLAGFAMTDWFGVRCAVLICGLLTCVSAGWGLASRGEVLQRLSWRRSIAWLGLGCVAVVTAISSRTVNGRPLPGAVPPGGSPVVLYREGPVDTVAVLQSGTDANQRLMAIDGVIIGQSEVELDEKQQMLAHLPMLLMTDRAPREGLTIGLGTGIVAAEMARHPTMDRVWAVELSPTVVEAAAEFRRWNDDVLHHDRVTVVQDDGLFFLKRLGHPVDVIVSDGKSVSTHAGNAIFFATEYYALCRERLTDDGIFMQWVPTSTPAVHLATIFATMRSSFEHIYVWCEPPFSLYWVGSRKPIHWNETEVAKRLGQPALASFRRHGWRQPESLLGLLVADSPILAGELPEAEANSLERPILEFFSRRDFERPASERLRDNLTWAAKLSSHELSDVRMTDVDAERLRAFRTFNAKLMEFSRQVVQDGVDISDPLRELISAAEPLGYHAMVARLAAPLCLELALVRHQKGGVEGAIDWYLLGLEAQPDDPALLRNVTIAWAQLSQFAQVVRFGRRAVSMHPDDMPLRLEYGVALLATGRPNEALEELKVVLAHDPHNQDARRAFDLATRAARKLLLPPAPR